jgi:hypothetical protein
MNMFDLFRAHRLRRTPHRKRDEAAKPARKLNLPVPTVFDNPPAMRCRRPKVPAPPSGGDLHYCCDCCEKADESTRTPGPIVLETATFFR